MPEDINPFYGTAKVLMAYRDANLFDTKEAQFGLKMATGKSERRRGLGRRAINQLAKPSSGRK